MPFSFHLEFVVPEPATLVLPGLGLVYRLGG
ncbi:MAG: PEP-CTERM sorting domain-containing protein, partial [Planctomycetes bacterium]|nr:PEP-CTERM sorting domain-containing protein [Planctomycetota bacterium]